MAAEEVGGELHAAAADLAEVLALVCDRRGGLGEQHGGDGAVDLGPEVGGLEAGGFGEEKLGAGFEAGGALG